eukprot:gene11084-19948_t
MEKWCQYKRRQRTVTVGNTFNAAVVHPGVYVECCQECPNWLWRKLQHHHPQGNGSLASSQRTKSNESHFSDNIEFEIILSENDNAEVGHQPYTKELIKTLSKSKYGSNKKVTIRLIMAANKHESLPVEELDDSLYLINEGFLEDEDLNSQIEDIAIEVTRDFEWFRMQRLWEGLQGMPWTIKALKFETLSCYFFL